MGVFISGLKINFKEILLFQKLYVNDKHADDLKTCMVYMHINIFQSGSILLQKFYISSTKNAIILLKSSGTYFRSVDYVLYKKIIKNSIMQ